MFRYWVSCWGWLEDGEKIATRLLLKIFFKKMLDNFLTMCYYYIVEVNNLIQGGIDMLNLEELKPILEGLLEGREDSADIIEQIGGLDKPVEVDRSEIDALNASWNERFKQAFFGEKASDINEEIPTVSEVEEVEEDETPLSYDELFTEVEEKQEEC